jgi:branched-chain amino acid aminotransferase
MGMKAKQYVWFDGKHVAFEDAKVHVLTHSLQYGSGIFEGLRAYKTQKGTAVFRLNDHVKRFFNTAKIYDMALGFSRDEIQDAILSTVKRNGLEEGYIRPFAFYNDQQIGLNPTGKKVSVFIAAVPFGSYFANKDKGIKCKVSSWRRINSEILPPEAKACGNYLNSILCSTEAKRAGADEAILLSCNGYVAEGPGENIFLVQGGKLVTPSRESDILLGLTRDSIIKLAENKGLLVEERFVHREELYTSDEVFFTGTAAELTPIVEIDSIKIGKGVVGPITKMLGEEFSGVINNEHPEFSDWLTYI